MLLDFNSSSQQSNRCGHQQQQHSQNHQQHHLSKQQTHQHPAMSSAYHSAGDDCAINELLEGRMDLDVLMPDGRKVRLTVERRTPMMDLLVQAASATKISPGGHVIHVFGEGDKGNGTLQYKPSTPIGSLDTKTICIVPKKEAGDHLTKRLGKPANRPFEPTFRVQVHLPRNQLTVLRVSPRIKISELKGMVCREKGLDGGRYQLVRPSSPTQPLGGDMTLAEYGSTEITLLSNSSIESHISTSHIIPYSKRSDDQKRKTGILRLLTEDIKNKANDNCNSNATCLIDGIQKSKTNDTSVYQHRYKPKKRRPAPPPPPPVLPEAPSHSRQSSSDSSGYHEATSSFLHEEHSGEEKASSDSSGVSSLGAKDPPIEPSPPPIPNSKKKKAPAPPPPPVQRRKLEQKDTAPVPIHSSENSTSQKESIPQNNSVAKHTVKHSAPLKNPTEPKKAENETTAFTTAKIIHKEVVEAADILPQSNKQIQKDPIIQEDSKTRRDSISLNQKITDSESSSKVLPSTPESAESKCPLPSKDPIKQQNAANLEEGLTEKDHVAQEICAIAGDQIPPKEDRVILADHVIPKDQIQNRDEEKKLDLHNLRENEGQQPRQPQMTVAAKALPAATAPADTIKESKSEISIVAHERKDSKALVPEIYKNKAPQKDPVSFKSEAVSTRVALVALNARIEQDVTQQEIASSIQAAFHSVDYSAQPSLLAIKQRNCDSPILHSVEGSDNHTPEPPAPPQKTTTLRVPLNFHSDNIKAATPPKLCAPEREALLIDEAPPPQPVSVSSASSKSLKRSSSLLNFTEAAPRNVASKNTRRDRQLQRSLSDLRADGKEDFEAEQERLQREYIKLQRQFILWQQQLMNNHVMLREECIVPQYARTLRQSHSLPEGEDYSDNTTTIPSGPLVSRSLSYEPTKDRCSTLPRSAINITSFEFGSIPINNGTSTLRSSKTKSYFKPPQIRASTKSRQRLPPEIKKEGDVDISDDTKMLSTILPSFESLKLITENNDEEMHSSFSRLKETVSATKASPTPSSEGKKLPLVHHSSTFPKINSRLNNTDKSADKNLKYVNGDTGQSKLPEDCPKVTGQSLNSQPPPPPPPPAPVAPVVGLSKCSVNQNCVKPVGQRNGVNKKDFTPRVDPREQLMLEIRKFGGRTALRKISLAS